GREARRLLPALRPAEDRRRDPDRRDEAADQQRRDRGPGRGHRGHDRAVGARRDREPPDRRAGHGPAEVGRLRRLRPLRLRLPELPGSGRVLRGVAGPVRAARARGREGGTGRIAAVAPEMAALLDRQRRPASPTGEMPFLDHLEELRWRILWSLLAIVVGSGIGIWLVMKYNVLALLIAPIEPYLETGKLMYLSPSDPFFLTLRLGLTAGLLLASPIVFYQIWAFVSPALLPQEKKAIVPALYLGLVLFAFGVVLAYLYALPMT